METRSQPNTLIYTRRAHRILSSDFKCLQPLLYKVLHARFDKIPEAEPDKMLRPLREQAQYHKNVTKARHKATGRKGPKVAGRLAALSAAQVAEGRPATRRKSTLRCYG